jgi:hypothetical protein
LISAHQNDLNTQKNINLKQIKKFQIFLKALLKRKKKKKTGNLCTDFG